MQHPSLLSVLDLPAYYIEVMWEIIPNSHLSNRVPRHIGNRGWVSDRCTGTKL